MYVSLIINNEIRLQILYQSVNYFYKELFETVNLNEKILKPHYIYLNCSLDNVVPESSS